MLQYYQYFIHSKVSLLLKNRPQDNSTAVDWCLNQLKDFILQFSINRSFFSQKVFLNFYIIILVSSPSGHSHQKRTDSLEGSLDRVLLAAELAFPKILAPFWSTDTS